MVRLGIHLAMQPDDNVRDVVIRSAERTLLMENSEDCEVSILLTNDDEIRDLNRQYRDTDSSTDVLAFAMREGIDGDLNDTVLGDVVISIPTAQKQSGVLGHSVEAEISLLVCHGVLHLLGYDHAEKNEAEVMEQKQKQVICSLGFELDESKLKLQTC